MWRNFRCLHITDVEKSEILHIWHMCDVEQFAIQAKFMQFSCAEILSLKVHLWRKNDKYQVWSAPDPLPSHYVFLLIFTAQVDSEWTGATLGSRYIYLQKHISNQGHICCNANVQNNMSNKYLNVTSSKIFCLCHILHKQVLHSSCGE